MQFTPQYDHQHMSFLHWMSVGILVSYPQQEALKPFLQFLYFLSRISLTFGKIPKLLFSQVYKIFPLSTSLYIFYITILHKLLFGLKKQTLV